MSKSGSISIQQTTYHCTTCSCPGMDSNTLLNSVSGRLFRATREAISFLGATPALVAILSDYDEYKFGFTGLKPGELTTAYQVAGQFLAAINWPGANGRYGKRFFAVTTTSPKYAGYIRSIEYSPGDWFDISDCPVREDLEWFKSATDKELIVYILKHLQALRDRVELAVANKSSILDLPGWDGSKYASYGDLTK